MGARNLNIKSLNVENAVTAFLLWLSWGDQDDIAGAVEFAGNQIETKEEVDQFKEALSMLNLVTRWKRLNKRHNWINKWYGEVYGGPDVSEKDFAERAPSIAAESRKFAYELDVIMVEKTNLEARMTEEELEQTQTL